MKPPDPGSSNGHKMPSPPWRENEPHLRPSRNRELNGVFVPTLVPWDEHAKINEVELRRFLQWLIAMGVHGLYPNGSTGEFARLNAEERDRIVRITCEEAAGRVPVLAGTGEESVAGTLRACERYAACGARAVAIISPFFYRISRDSVYAYYSEIARSSPIEITLYNIPMLANPIDLPTVCKLAEFPRIIGIKDSSGDIAAMMRMISSVRRVRPEFVFLSGWEPVFVPMLMAGCNGGTQAFGNAMPEYLCHIFEACRARRWDEAMALQYRMLSVFDAMFSDFEFPAGFRAGAEIRGFKFGKGRQPLTETQEQNQSTRKHALQQIMAGFGLTSDGPSDHATRA